MPPARDCIRYGLPVGLKTSDGKVYPLAGPNGSLNNQLADYATKTVTIKGIIGRRNGLLVLSEAVVERFD
jgi:hypothetical protein